MHLLFTIERDVVRSSFAIVHKSPLEVFFLYRFAYRDRYIAPLKYRHIRKSAPANLPKAQRRACVKATVKQRKRRRAASAGQKLKPFANARTASRKRVAVAHIAHGKRPSARHAAATHMARTRGVNAATFLRFVKKLVVGILWITNV
ncbi:hypothetical protein NPIL_562561 [Nephila pilipes]|uniref:Uncharacterized protein n=1 Tax=Nephila pilipes TaxID=299642 RepID=A0A8X6PWL0_NEPPI|nr:hypothetical protein NPIL_562561 [Nephila pilipes]